MKVSKSTLKNILVTLPIGYYANSRVDMEIDEEAATSYYVPTSNTIFISFDIISKGLENLTEDNEEYIETAVRSMLYHELSHALLTPKELMYYYPNFAKKEYSSLLGTNYRKCKDSCLANRIDIINIFEDERIETLLYDYYRNVNFKKQVYLITGYKGEAPKSAMQEFYYTCRFRVGEKENVDKVNEIISKYAEINWNSNCFYCEDYVDEFMLLYAKIWLKWNSNSKNKNSNASGTDKDFDIEQVIADYEKSVEENVKPNIQGTSSAEEEKENESGSEGKESDSKGKESDSEEIETEDKAKVSKEGLMGKTLIKKATSGRGTLDNNLYIALERIITSFNKKNNSGGSTNGYSGVFNPRNAARKDYKYFERSLSVNSANKFGSLHLNLFIDNSGSFKYNINKVHSLISCLLALEKRYNNFTVDFVKCGEGERVVTDKSRIIYECDEGTLLDHYIWDIYRKLQKSNTYNYNIVLYDGDCYALKDRKKSNNNFKCFEHTNCCIISDRENAGYLRNIKQAKVKITDKYTEELYKNVLECLQTAFR